MSAQIAERRICLPEFQAAIDERFGLNRFGGPRYRFAWGESETHTVQGRWGYEQRLLCPNIACWNLLRWRAPECYGTPQLYDLINRDRETGLCLLGEYPYEGAWEIVQALMTKEFHFATGLQVEIFPLDYVLIEQVLPLLEIAEEMGMEEIAAANEFIEAQENKRQVNEITDRLMDEYPTRFGPVSYGRGGCKTAVIDRKMHQISQVWNKMSKAQLRKQRAGFYQGAN